MKGTLQCKGWHFVDITNNTSYTYHISTRCQCYCWRHQEFMVRPFQATLGNPPAAQAALFDSTSKSEVKAGRQPTHQNPCIVSFGRQVSPPSSRFPYLKMQDRLYICKTIIFPNPNIPIQIVDQSCIRYRKQRLRRVNLVLGAPCLEVLVCNHQSIS